MICENPFHTPSLPLCDSLPPVDMLTGLKQLEIILEADCNELHHLEQFKFILPGVCQASSINFI